MHKLDLLRGRAPVAESHPEGALQGFLKDAKYIFRLDLLDRAIEWVVEGERSLADAPNEYGEARREGAYDGYLEHLKDLEAAGHRELRADEKEARVQCGRLVRAITGCAENGRPVLKGWPESDITWESISTEQRKALEAKFYEEVVARARSRVRPVAASDARKGASAARSRKPSNKPAGCGSTVLLFGILPLLTLAARSVFRALA